MRRKRGDFGGLPVGGMNRANEAFGLTGMTVSTAISPARSGRCSVGEDSGFEAGAAGLLGRHSQERTGEEIRASPLKTVEGSTAAGDRTS